MNELPVIAALFIRKGFWDRQGANIASRGNKMYDENLFRRPKTDFAEHNAFFNTDLSEIDLGNVDTRQV